MLELGGLTELPGPLAFPSYLPLPSTLDEFLSSHVEGGRYAPSKES